MATRDTTFVSGGKLTVVQIEVPDRDQTWVENGKLTVVGGGAAIDPIERFFSADGSTQSWYAGATQFNAVYDATSDKTFIAFQSFYIPTSKRFCRVIAYNHTTKKFGEAYALDISPIGADDDHDVSSIAINGDGRLVVSWGNHNGNFKLAVSTNARDESSWTIASDLVGAYTYPHLVRLANGSVSVFIRKQVAPGTPYAAGASILVTRNITFSGAAATIGSEVEVGNLGNDSRWYQGHAYMRPDGFIHQVCTRSNYADGYRKNIYYYKIDVANQQLINFDGSVTRSWPVSGADMESYFKVWSSDPSTSLTGNIPPLAFDAAGRAHTVAHEGPTTGGGSSSVSDQDIKYLIGESGVFSAAVNVAVTTQRYNSSQVVPQAGGVMRLYWTEDMRTEKARGGSIRYRDLPSGGAATDFGPAITVMEQSASRPSLDGVAVVLDGKSDLRAIWQEIGQTSADTNGKDKRLYAFGDGGFIYKPAPQFVDPPAFTGEGFFINLNDISTIFSDAAGTVPAVAGDVIRVLNEVNGNQFTGAAATGMALDFIGNRYCLRNYSRYLTGPSKSWTAGSGFACTMLIRHWMESTAANQIVGMDAGSGNTRLASFSSNGPQLRSIAFRSTTGYTAATGAAAAPYGNTYALQAFTDGDTNKLRVNGVDIASAAMGGAMNTGSVLARIGASAVASPSEFFKGAIFGIIFRAGPQDGAVLEGDYNSIWSMRPR